MHVPTSPNGAHSNGRTPTGGTNCHPGAGPDTRPPSANGERDSHGRFAAGNRGGPGNPFARQVAALRCALLAAVTPEDIEAVAQELLRQAKEGNLAAAKLLLSYTLGKPAPVADPDTLDAQEWEGYHRVPDPGADLMVMARRMPLDVACTMGRAMQEGLASDWTRQLADGFRQDQLRQQREDAAAAERAARRREKAERLDKQRQSAAPSANGPSGTPADAAGGNPRRPQDDRG